MNSIIKYLTPNRMVAWNKIVALFLLVALITTIFGLWHENAYTPLAGISAFVFSSMRLLIGRRVEKFYDAPRALGIFMYNKLLYTSYRDGHIYDHMYLKASGVETPLHDLEYRVLWL